MAKPLVEVKKPCHACRMETATLSAAERDARYTAEHRARKAALLQERIDAIVRRRLAGGQTEIDVRIPDYAERAAHDHYDD